MRTVLAIVVLVELVLPIYGQGKAPHPKSDNEHTQQDSSPPVAVTVHGSETPVQQENSPKEAIGTDNKPESYFKTLIAPNNLPNDLLVLVGLIGVGVAIWTLLTIKSQVGTFVSKERARVTVDIKPIEPGTAEQRKLRILYDKTPMPPLGSNDIWDAELLISNSGETNAFIGNSFCKACIRATGWDARTETVTSRIGLPKVMHPHTDPFRHTARIEIGQVLRPEVDEETAQAIADGSMGIYVIGHIEFGDVFDNRWTVKFCRKWGAWVFGGLWQETALWYEYPEGKSEINAEFRIKRPSMLRRILRRMLNEKPESPVIEIT